MAISKKMNQFAESSSWIRKMFEEGARLKAEFGAENVFDFSLGNPDLSPPPEFQKTLVDKSYEKSRKYRPTRPIGKSGRFIRSKTSLELCDDNFVAR